MRVYPNLFDFPVMPGCDPFFGYSAPCGHRYTAAKPPPALPVNVCIAKLSLRKRAPVRAIAVNGSFAPLVVGGQDDYFCFALIQYKEPL